LTALVLTAPVVSTTGDRTAPTALDSVVVPLPGVTPGTPTTTAPPTAPPPSAPPSTEVPSTEVPAIEAPAIEVSSPPRTADPAPASTEPTADSSMPAAEASAAPAAETAPGPEGQVLSLVNQERLAAGCLPLAADAQLAAVARAHSADMRDRGFFDHVSPDGLDPFDRTDRAGVSALAENIARGQPDASTVMASWMDSPGHRANILDCRLTRLGVGMADGAGGPWWTQLFG
jgi:uncharacterized protein YkwD